MNSLEALGMRIIRLVGVAVPTARQSGRFCSTYGRLRNISRMKFRLTRQVQPSIPSMRIHGRVV